MNNNHWDEPLFTKPKKIDLLSINQNKLNASLVFDERILRAAYDEWESITQRDNPDCEIGGANFFKFLLNFKYEI